MLKNLTNTALRAMVAGLVFSISAAMALSVTGRISDANRSIFQVGIPAVSTELAITASTTQTLAGAYQLTAGFSQVTTANANDAVKLPSMTTLNSPSNLDASLNIVIVNNTANTVGVFPFLATDVIVNNGAAGSAGAVLALPTLKTMECWSATGSGRWYCTIG